MALACADQGPREAPFPEFHLGRDRMSGGGGEPTTQLPVTLAETYLATLAIPAQGGEWTWSVQLDGKATLHTRIAEGNAPDVVVYAERGPDGAAMPSVQLRRFLAFADAGGDDAATWGLRYAETLRQRADAVQGEGKGRNDLLMPVVSALTGGLGFASTPGSFTGWKWVGRTAGTDGTDRVDVRLGRWTGTWTDGPSRVASAMAALDKVATSSAWWVAQRDALRKALADRGRSGSDSGAGAPGRPAIMWAGSVRLPRGGNDVHVAAICAEPCAHEREIRGLFESLRAGSAEELRTATQGSARRDPGAHERQARVFLLDTDALAGTLEQAAADAEQAPAGPIGGATIAPEPSVQR
jgi:hypothetical protein